MKLFVLDTDTLSLLQRGNYAVRSRAAQHAADETAITVITVDEQLRGWFSLVRRARKPAQIAFAYEQLARSVSDLSRTAILTFSERAIGIYESLRKAKIRIGGNDMRIAAIALEHQATVVTRNLRDFELVPGLAVEDWSK